MSAHEFPCVHEELSLKFNDSTQAEELISYGMNNDKYHDCVLNLKEKAQPAIPVGYCVFRAKPYWLAERPETSMF